MIEDDKLWRTKIQVMLDEIGIKILGIASTIASAEELLKNYKPDFIVADVLLQNENIFKLFNENPFCCSIPVIILTQSEREYFYNQAKIIDNCIYLVKPIHKLTLQSGIEQLLGKWQNKTVVEKSLTVKGKYNEKIHLPFSQIFYVEQEKNYCHIHCKNKTVVLKKSLTKILIELNNDFIQIHRTFAVNKNCINRYTSELQSVLLSNNIELPIGRIYREKVKQNLASQFVEK
ncbi:MAG: LytR/AlgR family response regulator transcription factor [Dolichospermum sp.]